MRIKIELFFSLVLVLFFIIVNAFAGSVVIEGKLASDVYKGPVLITTDNATYVLSNLQTEIQTRYLSKDVKVVGMIDRENKIISVDKIVNRDSGWKIIYDQWWYTDHSNQ
jgi:ligand-binding sensor protein